MRSPRRLSSQTTSERRRPRSDPSDRPSSFKGIWTRRPSDVTKTATWRRFRPSNRPNAISQRRTRPTRVVRAVYGAIGEHATTSGRWSSGAPPRTSVGRPQVSSRRLAPSRSGHDRNHETAGHPTVSSCPPCPRRASVPAVPCLENDGRAGECGQHQKDPKGLSLQHSSHLISTSGRLRRW